MIDAYTSYPDPWHDSVHGVHEVEQRPFLMADSAGSAIRIAKDADLLDRDLFQWNWTFLSRQIHPFDGQQKNITGVQHFEF